MKAMTDAGTAQDIVLASIRRMAIYSAETLHRLRLTEPHDARARCRLPPASASDIWISALILNFSIIIYETVSTRLS